MPDRRAREPQWLTDRLSPNAGTVAFALVAHRHLGDTGRSPSGRAHGRSAAGTSPAITQTRSFGSNGLIERVANVIEPSDHGVVVVGCWRAVSIDPARMAPVVAA